MILKLNTVQYKIGFLEVLMVKEEFLILLQKEGYVRPMLKSPGHRLRLGVL
jgi:hypothetical protein